MNLTTEGPWALSRNFARLTGCILSFWTVNFFANPHHLSLCAGTSANWTAPQGQVDPSMWTSMASSVPQHPGMGGFVSGCDPTLHAAQQQQQVQSRLRLIFSGNKMSCWINRSPLKPHLISNNSIRFNLNLNLHTLLLRLIHLQLLHPQKPNRPDPKSPHFLTRVLYWRRWGRRSKRRSPLRSVTCVKKTNNDALRITPTLCPGTILSRNRRWHRRLLPQLPTLSLSRMCRSRSKSCRWPGSWILSLNSPETEMLLSLRRSKGLGSERWETSEQKVLITVPWQTCASTWVSWQTDWPCSMPPITPLRTSNRRMTAPNFPAILTSWCSLRHFEIIAFRDLAASSKKPRCCGACVWTISRDVKPVPVRICKGLLFNYFLAGGVVGILGVTTQRRHSKFAVICNLDADCTYLLFRHSNRLS